MKAQTGARVEPRDPRQRTGGSKVAERLTESSPRLKARMVGVFFLLSILTGVFA